METVNTGQALLPREARKCQRVSAQTAHLSISGDKKVRANQVCAEAPVFIHYWLLRFMGLCGSASAMKGLKRSHAVLHQRGKCAVGKRLRRLEITE